VISSDIPSFVICETAAGPHTTLPSFEFLLHTIASCVS
jgi:hypothetical protein